MKRELSLLNTIIACAMIITCLYSCTKEDSNGDDTKAIENIIGYWDATSLSYILSHGEIDVDDLIKQYSVGPDNETQEEEQKRETVHDNLLNNKFVWEDLWNANITEEGGSIIFLGYDQSGEKITSWTKNKDNTYNLNYGEGTKQIKILITLTSNEEGYFVILPEKALKVYMEKQPEIAE
jgi:hypothetical protein